MGMKLKIDKRIKRPPFCFDKTNKVIYSTYDKEDFDKGWSFFCYGKLSKLHVFRERKVEHRNDMCHCYYTPLKGMIKFYINIEDILGETQAGIAVINRLSRPHCPECGEDMYKIVKYECPRCILNKEG